MPDEKVDQDPKPAVAAAKPAPPPKVEAPSLPPEEMVGADLKAFLRDRLKSGEEITVEIGKTIFTGRLFRTMVHEGWIALEHVDGRRKAFMIIEGGRIRDGAGKEFTLPGGHGK